MAAPRPRPRRSKKWPKNSKFYSFLEILREVYVQNPKIIACWMRLVILYNREILKNSKNHLKLTLFTNVYLQNIKNSAR
jgi:hypothetical protein